MIPARRQTPSARAAPLPPPRAVSGALLAVAVLLSGCQGGLQPPSMLAFGRGHAPADPALGQRLAPESGTAASPVIADLAARRSVLPPGSAYARVADAVLAANPGADAAELGLARLRAEAASRNGWPTIAPAVTLNSLAGLAAQLVIDQPLLDHGRRQAERARAAAEVDLAAVTLSTRQNARIHEGLSLYLIAEQARAQSAIAARAATRLSALHDIVQARIDGGLSDRSEAQIIAQTMAEMQATLATDTQTRTQALADLAALTGHTPPADLTGTHPLPAAPQTDALSVLKAQADGNKALAEARITRANALPGLSANATLSEDGVTPGLGLGGVRLGLGSPATLAAAAATPDLVARQTAEQRQTADRRRTELQGRIDQLRTRQLQGESVLRQTLENLDLYVEQYSIGRRSLTDLTAQTAAAARLERDQAAFPYDTARLELELARDIGALVDGGRL
jgi:outer membrane protein, adhesin transport system